MCDVVEGILWFFPMELFMEVQGFYREMTLAVKSDIKNSFVHASDN